MCIHGHFYQPPRENPWTGEIEKQESAAPYDNWNEKIWDECYKTNADANNFRSLSFNFGPTLLAWIQKKHPETYAKIIGSDRDSIQSHGGHGNAIAMCYNHTIMPLANLNDKITQITWGLEDFKYHFGRDAESIWLPETACDMETIEVLIQQNIKYIILNPSQAESVKEENSLQWLNVSDSSINPFHSYKCYSQKDRHNFINIFFYDGLLSKSVSFDDILYSPETFLEKVRGASPKENGDTLLSIATDGETFGHHKRNTEKTIAAFFAEIAPATGIEIMNFGEFLEKNPARYEVKIKAGGTSWSCPHGVKRWLEDCGCGRMGGWNQKWRKPLRDSLNWLRDELIIVFEDVGSEYFKDIWKARNDYIKLINDNSPAAVMNFFAGNAKRILSKEEIIVCYMLLEMQKFSMLMFTSCGWFFSELSGLETVQILQYAARAIEIAEQLSEKSYQKEFVSGLSAARSNMPEFADGTGVWEKLVRREVAA